MNTIYTDHFGIAESPFTIAPDPRFLYQSKRHQEALAHLLYGIQVGGGFVQLSGEVGTGKTTLIRALLRRIPADVEIALVLNPRVSATEFLATILDELNIPAPEASGIKALVDALNRHLLASFAAGRRVALIIDEAQNLEWDVLEQVRLLTNLETETQKLLQIILVGQPELRSVLARHDLRQLAQRITARYHLSTLSLDETGAYIRHRLRTAGLPKQTFSTAAIRHVHRCSRGVPRLINVICDRAMLGAFAEGIHQIDASLARQASRELEGVAPPHFLRTMRRWLVPFGATAMLVAGSAALAISWNSHSRDEHSRAAEPGLSTELAHAATITHDSSAQHDLASLPILDIHNSRPNEDGVYAGLFDAWGVKYDALRGATPCDKAIDCGLRCYSARGSLADLLRLDRPAIAILDHGAHGDPIPLAILGKRADHLVVTPDGQHSYAIPPGELEAMWPGQFVTLYKPILPGDAGPKLGARGAAIDWLRKQLGGPKNYHGDGLPYDHSLQQRLVDFQTSEQLAATGELNIMTTLLLQKAAGSPNLPLISTYH